MNIRTMVSFILVLAATRITAGTVSAKEISIKGNSKSAVIKGCGAAGDVYWVQGENGHTYGCMHGNGSGIVCGGVTKTQKASCSTFKTGSLQTPKLPTRDQDAAAKEVQK